MFCMGFRYVHVCTNDYPYYCCMGFRHVHVCTNDYPYYCCMGFRHVHFCTTDYLLILDGFSSCTFLYGWLLPHFEWISVMYLYEWLPLLFELIVVIYISVRMTTILFWIDCCHLHFCTNHYLFFLNGLLSCTFLYEWLPSLFEWIVVIYICPSGR